MGNSWLAYQTTKMVKIDYWQAGVAYYTLAIGAFLIAFVPALNAGTFQVKEPVAGFVNGFPESATHPYYSCAATSTCSTVRPGLLTKDYCSAASHNFYYSEDFKYFSGNEAGSGDAAAVGPECRFLGAKEVLTKDAVSLSMTTVFTEEQKFGWPLGGSATCSSVGTTFAQQAMAQCNTAVTTDPTTGQCECEAKTSVFPSQVEDYDIVLAHGYQVTDLAGRSWNDQSGDKNGLLHTYIVGFPNGSSVAYNPGAEIKLTLKEILAMAEHTDRGGNYKPGLKLDDDNDLVPEDSRPTIQTKPKYRHTGITIDLSMVYTNRPNNELVFHNQDVDVTISVKVNSKEWRSTGPKFFYPTYPVGALGSQTFHSVVRYPQDVRINFDVKGYAYAFDAVQVIRAIVDIVVLVGVAKTIMDFVVFYLLPNGVSLVLRNKRAEYTSRRAAFQELGLKAAVSVQQFKALDEGKHGKLNLPELVKVFGDVKDVDRDRAMMIAKTILGDKEFIDFEEFMSIAHGDAITFKEYLKLVKNTGGNLHRLSLFQKEQAMKAYADVEKGISLPETSEPPPQAAAGAVATTQVVAPAPQPVMPAGVVKLMCHQCRRPFGVPAGAKMVACPHCQAVNNCQTVVQPM